MLCFSCKPNQTHQANNEEDIAVNKQEVDVEKKEIIQKVNKDTITYISYEYEGDYPILYGKSKGEKVNYNYEWPLNGLDKINRGDLIEVEWEMDTIYIAGEGDKPELTQWALRLNKLQDGNVSIFKKKYPKPLRYLTSEDNKYTDKFYDDIYRLVEYYLANSDRSAIRVSIEQKTPIIYSIEETERDGENYIMIGISQDFEDHTVNLQWLYVSIGEEEKLYEYDLSNDELIEFNP